MGKWYKTLHRMIKRNRLSIASLFGLILLAVFLYAAANPKIATLSTTVLDMINRYHVAPTPVDDAYSKRLFALYIKRLDPGKRFFTAADIDRLRVYETELDDQLKSGDMVFVEKANDILLRRVAEAKQVVAGIIQTPQSFTSADTFSTDSDSRQFAASTADWTDDWRRFVQYQILTNYIVAAESSSSNANALVVLDPKLAQEARQKAEKNIASFFDRITRETTQDRIDAFIDAAASAQDPHTSYLAPQQKDDFDINIKGTLEGIGALLQEEDGYIKVTRIVPGGPAWRQKELKAQDIILKVAQDGGEPVDIVGARVQDAVKLIRGSKGTKARLTVRKPEGKIVQIDITRDVVVLEESYSKSAILKAPDGQLVGYIMLPSFYRDFSNSKARNAADDIRAELNRLKAKGVQSVILDLRNNGGGALEDAVKITGLFIDYGPVVQVRDRAGRGYTYEDTDPSVVFDGDLVVLTNVFSASASEIVAAALQDYGRAVILGAGHTYGKGTVQTVLNLDSVWGRLGGADKDGAGSIKVTNQKYYRVTGGSTQFKGVVPDIVAPEPNDYLDVGERALKYPLPWSTTTSANIQRWVRPIPKSVIVASQARIQANPSFTQLEALTKRLKARRESTPFPLNLQAAVKLQKDAKKESEELDQLKLAKPVLIGLPADDDVLATLETERRTEYMDWIQQLPKDLLINEAVQVIQDMRRR